MKIIVDTFGADKGYKEIIKGAVDSLNKFDIDIVLVGDKNAIEKELSNYKINLKRIEIIHAESVIENTDSPALAIRRKKDSSLVISMNALKDGIGDGLVSCGSTGALLAGGLFIIKRIKGIERAALASIFPSTKGTSFLLDMGANVDCKPEYLYQFGVMGSIYVENILGIKNPRVGLINIGEEEGKGDSLRNESFHLLSNSELNFIGNYEVRNIMTGECEVMVCDGFVGNIILKTAEGMAMSVKSLLKEEVMKSLKSKIGISLLKGNLDRIKDNLDYREYGGALLLGVKKPIVKAHGSSDSYAIVNAIGQAIKVIDEDIISTIEKNI